MDDSIEVFWDHDSPTPAVWKRLQGPSSSQDTMQCSPQLVRTKRKLPSNTRKAVDTYPRFEQSREKANQIINALRRASREGEMLSSNVGKRLVIPDLPEEEESDDDRHVPTIPFRDCLNHTSLDVMFDMSGNGEDLASTVRSTDTVIKHVPPVSPKSDDWADDELFSNDLLMSQVDQAAGIASLRPALKSKENASANQKTSTPSSSATKTYSRLTGNEGGEGTNVNAKGFLNFFMENKKPPKPSPNKNRSRASKNRLSQKTSPSRPVTRNGVDKLRSGSGDMTTGSVKAKVRLPVENVELSVSGRCNGNSKPLDTSIPIDVLEGLIEDSWTETDDEKDTAQIKVVKHKDSVNSDSKSSKAETTLRPAVELQGRPTVPTSYKFRRTDGRKPAVQRLSASSDLTGSKLDSNAKSNGQPQGVSAPKKIIVSSDGFSSDDEDILLEAVALTESQQSSSSKGPTSTAKSGVHKIHTPQSEASAFSKCKQPAQDSVGSSQTKCSVSEIEKKKQMAMERRMQRMREKNQHRR